MGTESNPQMAVIIESIIKSMGIEDFDQSVVQQLLKFIYIYSMEVIEDAKVYATHANKKSLDNSDISLALKLLSIERDEKIGPMTTSSLRKLARVYNSVPLKIVKPKDGLRLPEHHYCSTAVNYKLKPGFSGQLSQTVAARPMMSARRATTQKNSACFADSEVKSPEVGVSGTQPKDGAPVPAKVPFVDLEDDCSANRKRRHDDHE